MESKFDALVEEVLEEKKKWAGDVEVKKGKMHSLLGVPKDKKVSDVFKSGKELAEALLKALKGNKKKAASMLAFPANVNKGEDVFDKALEALKAMDKDEKKK